MNFLINHYYDRKTGNNKLETAKNIYLEKNTNGVEIKQDRTFRQTHFQNNFITTKKTQVYYKKLPCSNSGQRYSMLLRMESK